MTDILLTSERFVKDETPMSDNLDSKYLRTAMRQAQEGPYRHIVGDALFGKLKALVADGSIETDANARYKELLDISQRFLAYTAFVYVTTSVAYKVANAGVIKTADENIANASHDEIVKLKKQYQSWADMECRDIQGWLLGHGSDVPELGGGGCARVKAQLYSAATCGIFLGGARGKRRARR